MVEQRLARLLDPSFLDGVEDWSTERLREERAACEAEEEAVSYARRVLQGRVDILRAELQRRSDGAALDLLERLPAILAADQSGARPSAAHVRSTRLRVPAGADAYEARIDAIVDESRLERIDGEQVGDIEAIVDRLVGVEQDLSATRRDLFGRIDAIRAELADRYKDGRASVRDLLGGEQG
jgi:hypothetical protein